MNKILLIIFLNILVAVLGKEYERLPKMVIIDLGKELNYFLYCSWQRTSIFFYSGLRENRNSLSRHT